jgi:hypothetical protein
VSAEIASLSFSIDSAPLAQASSRMEQLGQSAQAAGGKSSQLLSAVDALVAALNRNTAATDQLTAKMDALQVSGAKTAQVVAQVGQAADVPATNVVRFRGATDALRPSMDAAAASAAKLREAWSGLSAQGAATLRNMEMMAKLASSSALQPNAGWSRIGQMGAAQSFAVTPVGRLSNLRSDGSVPGAPAPGTAANANAPGGGRLAGYQLQNLAYQGGDVLSQLGSGTSLGQVAFQQGPQIAQIFGGAGGASVRGAISQAGEAASSLAARVGLLGGAFGAAALGLGALLYALSSYRDQQKELQLSVAGRGRASGATVGDVNRTAQAGAAAGGVSVAGARDLAGDYAQTGAIGMEMYAGLIKVARDYAETTRQELPDANKALAAAFADPAKGAETLAGQLANLNAEQVESIQRMAASGDRLGAQRALLDSLGGSLVSATDRLGFFSRQWEQFKNNTSNEFDAIGRVVDRVISGGDLEQQIATAKAVLANSQARQSYLPFGIGQGDTDKAQAQLDALLAKQKQVQDENRKADLNLRSRAVDTIVKAANPADEQLKTLETQAKRIRTELAAGVLDPDGSSLRTAQGLETSAKRIREDLAAGGSELAAGLRRVQFESTQVGAVGLGRTSAQINNDYAEKQRQIEASNQNPNERNAALQALELQRVTELQTAERTSNLGANARGGAFSRMSPAVQAQINAAAQMYPQIPPEIIAGIADKESGGNPNVGRTKIKDANGNPASTATGLGQVTAPTARAGIQGGYLPSDFDSSNPNQGAIGIAGVLKMKLDAAGGDMDKAIANYYGSKNPIANLQYAADVKRRAGQMGDATVGGQIQGVDTRARQIESENQKLADNSKYLGENSLKLDTMTRYHEALSAEMAKGVPVTDELKNSLMAAAEASANTTRGLTNLRAAADLRFDDQQMGRDRYTSQAYGSARSLYGDTNSPDAQRYITQKRDQLEVQDAKGTLQDASTGFVQALSKGADAASAFSSALSKIGDKLISGALDSLFSSAFKGLGSGGGLGGLLGGLLPSGGLFANGGIMTARGPVQLRTYANGGVANSPQLAVYGEGSGPEAYVPLPDGKRIPVAMQAPANANTPVAGGGTSQINVYAPGATMTPEEYKGITMQAIAENNAQQRATQYSRGVADRRAIG